jgi:hypothetical protein
VQMRLECSGVPVHFERKNFPIVVFGQQHFELQRAGSLFRRALCAASKVTT